MKKSFLILATAALFAACSNEKALTIEPVAQQQADDNDVTFGAYLNRTTTRAGLAGDTIVIDSLKKSGFGVFGYYTNADNYDQTFTPNFMYNQLVKFNAGKWEYSPVKYWPNEHGTQAASDDADKVSFFAYAPYVSVNVSSGKPNGDGSIYAADNGDVTSGIVGLTKNNATGDPMVQFISTAYTDKQVDLLWGTVAKDADVAWTLKQGGSSSTLTQTIKKGLPWTDVQHPYATGSTTWGSAQKVEFQFQHALAALNVTVDTYADVKTPDGGSTSADPDTDTKVFIRSVTFEGFDTKGALNLNNIDDTPKALWYSFDYGKELNNGAEFSIYDGRKDGKEGLTAATKEYAAINPNFVQDSVWVDLVQSTGVTKKAENLFCQSNGDTAAYATDHILVIPNSDPLKVTIEYDVLTKDDNLAGTLNDGVTKGSVVKNVITRYITATSEAGNPTSGTLVLENGKQYTIKLHLGLNRVEFDATVSAWDDPTTGGASLPENY